MASTSVTSLLSASWEASDFSSGGTSWSDNVSSKSLTLSSAATKDSDGIKFNSSTTFCSALLYSLYLSYPMTFEWFGRIDSMNGGDLFSLSVTADSADAISCFANGSGGGIQLSIGTDVIQSNVTASGYHHIVFTVNSSGIVSLYVDSASPKGSQSASNYYGRQNKYYLYNTVGDNRFVGSISFMRAWEKELTESEISTLFTESPLPSTPDPDPDPDPTPSNVTITCSSNYTTAEGNINNIVDGDDDTYWRTSDYQEFGKYILFTFSESVTLTGICIKTYDYTSECLTSSNALQTSPDGETWNTFEELSGSSIYTKTGLTISDVKYVRIYSSSFNASSALCINEVEFTFEGTSVTPPTPTSENLYLKQNGAWVSVGTVYKKVNGAWVEQSDLSGIFSASVNFVKG